MVTTNNPFMKKRNTLMLTDIQNIPNESFSNINIEKIHLNQYNWFDPSNRSILE